jgi:hypothetical protein
MKEPAGVAAISFGCAIRFVFAVEAAEDIVLGGPANVVANKKVEKAVAIVIEPDGGCAETLLVEEARGFGDVDERALAGVPEKIALANARDEEIGEAIVVVVTDGDAHTVEFHVEAGNFGDVSEGAVAVVAVELERGALALVTGPIHGIDEEDVGPAVGVVIEKGATRAESFREEFAAVGAAVVVKLNAGLRGDIPELKAKGVGG